MEPALLPEINITDVWRVKFGMHPSKNMYLTLKVSMAILVFLETAFPSPGCAFFVPKRVSGPSMWESLLIT
jgi:hypothetical protein